MERAFLYLHDARQGQPQLVHCYKQRDPHEEYWRAGAPLRQIKTEGAGLVQLEEERTSGRPHCDLPVLISRNGTDYRHSLIVIGQGGRALN